VMSWQNSSSSNPAAARMRLSRIAGKGNISAHGWCGTVRWRVVGVREGGIEYGD
jgi:hypothetical protein